MANYDIGDRVRFSVAITVDGVDTDPTSLTFKIKASDGTVQTFVYGTDVEIVQDNAGNYHADIDINRPSGKSYYRWETTGTVVGAEENYFTVKTSQF